MTRANDNRHTPWFAQAGAACSIVPIARFVAPQFFALKGGGYGCVFALTGIDEEGHTDEELDAQATTLEAALHGLPENACLYQYVRIVNGFDLPRQEHYDNPVTENFVNDRLTFLAEKANFRRVSLFWCLTIEPPRRNVFAQSKPTDNASNSERTLAELYKAASILESTLSSSIELRLLHKQEAFQFFSYLFNLEDWADRQQLRTDDGVDRQVVASPISWHSDHLKVGRRYVQTFSLTNTPEASRPCLFNGVMMLDCDAVLCSTWRPKSSDETRKEITNQEKFIEFFKHSIFQRLLSGKNLQPLENTAGAKAASSSVDDLSEVVKSLDKKAQGEYSLRLLVAATSKTQLNTCIPAVHRLLSMHAPPSWKRR